MATNVKTNAKTKDEVDQMSAKDRMWDSLSYSYGKKKEESDRSYDKAISQQDRALLQRGMQRSSYGMNTLGNLQNQKVNAGNDINSQLIADYENRLYQLDRDEIEDAFRREQFDETKRQFDENLGFQKSEAERAQGNWQKEYDANRADTTWSQNFQQAQADLQKEQWNKEFEANRSDTLWNQNFQQSEAERAQSNWQSEFDANRADTLWNQNYQQAQADFQREQWEAQKEQWREEFDYNKMSDEQKLNYEYVMLAIQNGADVSDDMLSKAGLSRADFNSMRNAYTANQQKSSYGGSYSGGYNKKKSSSDSSDSDDSDASGISDSELESSLNGVGSYVRKPLSATSSNVAAGLNAVPVGADKDSAEYKYNTYKSALVAETKNRALDAQAQRKLEEKLKGGK